jgi:cell division protein FtsL
MSDATTSAEHDRWSGLPAWLRPRRKDLPGSGRLRLIETTLLLLLGVLLAVATVNDVVRQTHVNRRLIADMTTWRAYTGHSYHNLSIEQELFGPGSQHEVVCGNTSPGGPKARTQICLVVYGPVASGRRTVHGGWYLPRKVEDVRADRYGCFGAASRGMCPR